MIGEHLYAKKKNQILIIQITKIKKDLIIMYYYFILTTNYELLYFCTFFFTYIITILKIIYKIYIIN